MAKDLQKKVIKIKYTIAQGGNAEKSITVDPEIDIRTLGKKLCREDYLPYEETSIYLDGFTIPINEQFDEDEKVEKILQTKNVEDESRDELEFCLVTITAGSTKESPPTLERDEIFVVSEVPQRIIIGSKDNFKVLDVDSVGGFIALEKSQTQMPNEVWKKIMKKMKMTKIGKALIIIESDSDVSNHGQQIQENQIQFQYNTREYNVFTDCDLKIHANKRVTLFEKDSLFNKMKQDEKDGKPPSIPDSEDEKIYHAYSRMDAVKDSYRETCNKNLGMFPDKPTSTSMGKKVGGAMAKAAASGVAKGVAKGVTTAAIAAAV